MSEQSTFLRRFFICLTIGIFAVPLFAIADNSFAQHRERRMRNSPPVTRSPDRRIGTSSREYRRLERGVRSAPRNIRHRDRRRVISPPVTRYGRVVPRLPRGYRRIWHRKEPYYYNHGVFYRRSPSGFLVIRPPLGAVLVSLPIGYTRIWVDGGMYYTYGGVFYRRVSRGYSVVAPPVDVILEEEVPAIVQPSETDSGQVSVTASILNVRSGPSIHDPIIYQIHRGYILDIHGRADGWLYVELPNGESGWVMAEYTYRLKSPGSG